jgi:hypothetical protein
VNAQDTHSSTREWRAEPNLGGLCRLYLALSARKPTLHRRVSVSRARMMPNNDDKELPNAD